MLNILIYRKLKSIKSLRPQGVRQSGAAVKAENLME